jgi:tRNA (mo5U34)-methyltransferase
MAFIEHGFANDPTNWWVPNHAACEAMLRSCGLRVTGRPADEIYLCEPQPGQAGGSDAELDAALHAVRVLQA